MTTSENRTPFLTRLTGMVASPPPDDAPELGYVRQAFEDTMAVIYAGWMEPVTQSLLDLYADGHRKAPHDFAAGSPEDEALILGTAAHALDFDDVHQTSSTHPSAPIVAALLALARRHPELRGGMTAAFATGLAANVGLGRVLGFSHYDKGWHATSTIGPLAAAAACSTLLGLDAATAAAALALATAQAGGLQRNFGAMAKPMQAGLAAAAGLRAARLASRGVTADPDVFAPKGFFDLYGGKEFGEDPGTVEFDWREGGIAVKLYPCCYQTHRPIAAALEARDLMAERGLVPGDLKSIEVNAPASAFLPLRVLDPQTGSQGKFCGAYTVACALLDGKVGLAHFEDGAVQRPDVRELLGRIRLTERDGKPNGLERRSGPLHFIARDAAGSEMFRTTVIPAPGSPDSPPTLEQMAEKVRDCLAHFNRNSGQNFGYEQFQQAINQWLAAKEMQPVAAVGG